MAKKQTLKSEKKQINPNIIVQTYNNSLPASGKSLIYAIATLLFLPVVIAPLWTKYGYSPDLHMSFIIQVGITALSTWFAFSHLRRSQFFIIPSPLIYAVVGFYAWALLSLIWSYNRFESLISLLDWGAGVLAFILIIHSVRKPEDIKVIVQGIFFTGVLMGLLGFFQFIFEVEWVQQHAKPSATFNNKNMAAQYTLMTIGLGLGLMWSSQDKQSIWLYALGTSLITLFVFYTNTRGANLASAGIFLFMTIFILVDRIFNKRKGPMNKEKWLATGTAIALFVFLSMFTSNGFVGLEPYGVLVNESSGVFTNEFNPNTLQRGTRLDMWANSTAMIKDHPILGVGMGNWMVYYPLYQTAVSIDREMSEAIQHINAHNDYIEILSDLGIVGIILLLSIFATAIFLALKTFYQSPENPNRYLLLGVLLAATGISINAIGSFPFKQPAPILMTCVYLAIIASEYARWKNTKVITVKSKPITLTISFLLLFLSTSALALHLQWNTSEINFRLATISSSQQKFNKMIQYGLKSYDALPLRSRMLNFAGMGYLRIGNPVKAAEYLERVKDAYPYRNNTLQNLGYTYLEIAEQEKRKKNYQSYFKNLTKAADNFSTLVKIRPDNMRARKNLGITYYRQATLLKDKARMEKMLDSSTQLEEVIRRNKSLSNSSSLANLAKNLRSEAAKIKTRLEATTKAVK